MEIERVQFVNDDRPQDLLVHGVAVYLFELERHFGHHNHYSSAYLQSLA